MKIFFLVSTLRRTGPTRQLLNLTKGLKYRKHDVVVCTLSPESSDSMRPEFLEADIELVQLGIGRLSGLIRARRVVQRQIESYAPHVIHSQGIRPDTINSGLDFPARVCTQRNDPYQDYPAKFGRVLGRGMAMRHLRALRGVPAVVSCSQSIQDTLQRYGVPSKAIRNAVDVEAYKPRERFEPVESRDRYQGVFVGQIIPGKDPITLLRALAAGASKKWSVTFLGDGAQRNECERFARENGISDAVSFEGQVDDVRPYLQRSDALISTSHGEGFPNSVLEGIACGLAPILTDIPPHVEAMSGEPDICSFFKVGEFKELAGILTEWSPPNPLEVRDFAERFHGVQGMVEKYINLYEELTRKGVVR